MHTQNENLSRPDFNRLCSLIYEESGINLDPDKKTMLEIRIKRRLRSLEFSSYAEYCNYLFAADNQRQGTGSSDRCRYDQ